MLEDVIIPKVIIDRFMALMNLDYEDLIKIHVSVTPGVHGEHTGARIRDEDDIRPIIGVLDSCFDRDNLAMTKAYDDFVIFPFRIRLTLRYFLNKALSTISDEEDSDSWYDIFRLHVFASIVNTITEDRVPMHDNNERMATNIVLAASAYDVAREAWLVIENKLKASDPFFFSTYKMYKALLDTNMCEVYGKDLVELCIFTFINNTIRMDMITNEFKYPLTTKESDELLRISNKIISIAQRLTDANADDDDVTAFSDLLDKHDSFITDLMYKYGN